MEVSQTVQMVKDVFARYDQTGEGIITREDLIKLFELLGITGDGQILLKEFCETSAEKISYKDFVNKIFGVPTEEVSIHSAMPGDEVAVPLPGQTGTILKRTTTEVQLKLPDGNDVWFDIEDVDGGGPINIHEVAKGGRASLRGGDRYQIVDRQTCAVKLRYPDGREVWHEVEDLDDEAEQSSLVALVGSAAKVAPKTMRARVRDRTTTDALVVLPNGVEVWRAIDELSPTAVAPNVAAATRLKEIFDQVDTSRDGCINKRELIKICRSDSSIADFFGLATVIRQEDGSRDNMERLFQAIDTDSDRQLSWAEFRSFFLECRAGKVTGSSGDVVRALSAPAAITDG